MTRLAIVFDDALHERVRRHLLGSVVEEAAFLFAEEAESPEELVFAVKDAYLVPPKGWEAQHSDYLELRDTERARVLQLARRSGLALIDCHVHHGQGDELAFSPSDVRGITEFVPYVRWKLAGASYLAMVWNELAFDAVAWPRAVDPPVAVDEVRIGDRTIRPRASWFARHSRSL